MHYSDPKLQSLLAAEYVLGSLRGAASRRFERLLESEPGMRQALIYWQNRLNPLAENTKPRQPSKKVWKGIKNRINYGSIHHPRGVTALWGSAAFWRSISFAIVVSVVIGINIGSNQSPQSVIQHMQTVAVLQDQAARPKLVASLQEDGNALVLEMLSQADSMEPGKVMQVWCVPKGGGKPVSLGLLSTDNSRFELSLEQVQNLHESEEIAISVEPAGGSPMGEPTGPVMYRGTII